MERHCTIGDVQHLGRAWALPHPDRLVPWHCADGTDEEIEKDRRARRDRL